MRVIAVPVKPLARAKSRLVPLLRPAERATLSLVMLQDVLEACVQQPGWETWVVSRDRAALEAGSRVGARPVHEEGNSLLSAVRQVERGMPPAPSELAIVLADLPLLSAGAVAVALAAGDAPVVASPASSDGGTNLLLRRPPSVIPARFGRSSFARHRAEAYRRGLTFREATVPELGFDLDRPADVARLLEQDQPSRTRSACMELGLADRLRVLV
jgi:2-phospho-L-lactate/phosphoenolpyruvate guanylyltransferase